MRVLVTGATSGIGRACVEYLASQGHIIIATGRNRAILSQLEETARAKVWKLYALHLDVTDASEVANVAANVEDLIGGIDALVNNAGYGQAGFLADVTAEQARAQFDVSFFGLFEVTHAFLPQLIRNHGVVLNIGSIMGRMTAPWMGVYGAVKAAVRSLTETMRVEMGALGVKVVLLEPGAVESGFHERATGERREASLGLSPFATANLWLRDHAYSPLSMMKAVPSLEIARLVGRIIVSVRPRPRYVAPFGARLLLLFMAVTPVRILDPLKRRIFHVAKGPGTAHR